MADVETITCDNCHRAIAAANHTVHVNHCRRHLSVCGQCGEPVPRADMDHHHSSQHRRLQCTLCGEHVFAGLLDSHKEDRCSGRAVSCPYCELSMPFSSLEEHESYCGSRTELCPTCDVRVMYKYWRLHVESGHNMSRPDRPRSPPKAEDSRGAGGRRSLLREDTTPQRSYSFGDCISLDDKIASYVRKPVEEIVEDTMETWRKRKDLRKFEDDCFEQAMLMAIELSKASAAQVPPEPVDCWRCGRSFSTDSIAAHKSSCSWEEQEPRTRELPAASSKSALRRPSSDGAGWPCALGLVPPVVDRGATREQDVTLPCEFCDSSLRDDDLLRHQLRCEKNPNRLDLPPHRACLPRDDDLPKPRDEPDALLEGSSYYRRQSELLNTRWRETVTTNIDPGDTSRRWSLLDIDANLPKAPHRSKSKQKKKVNFLGQDEFIHPEPEFVPEVKEEKKKKKKHKGCQSENPPSADADREKRSSKKHRAPDPPVDSPSGLLSCDY